MLRDSPKGLGNFSHPHPQAVGTDHKLPRLPPDSPSSPERKERTRREENDKLIELLLADLKETEFAYRNYCKILLEEQASLKKYIESILVAHSTLLLTYDIDSILSWSEQCKEIYTPYITHFELLGDENRDWVIKRPLMRIRYFVKLCKKLTFLDEDPRLKKAFEDCHEVMLLARDKLAYQKELQYNGSSDLIGSAGDEMADGSGSLPLQGSYETLSPTSLLSPFKTFNFDNKIKNSHKQLLPALDPDEAALNARLPSEVGIDANQTDIQSSRNNISKPLPRIPDVMEDADERSLPPTPTSGNHILRSPARRNRHGTPRLPALQFSHSPMDIPLPPDSPEAKRRSAILRNNVPPQRLDYGDGTNVERSPPFKPCSPLRIEKSRQENDHSVGPGGYSNLPENVGRHEKANNGFQLEERPFEESVKSTDVQTSEAAAGHGRFRRFGPNRSMTARDPNDYYESDVKWQSKTQSSKLTDIPRTGVFNPPTNRGKAPYAAHAVGDAESPISQPSKTSSLGSTAESTAPSAAPPEKLPFANGTTVDEDKIPLPRPPELEWSSPPSSEASSLHDAQLTDSERPLSQPLPSTSRQSSPNRRPNSPLKNEYTPTKTPVDEQSDYFPEHGDSSASTAFQTQSSQQELSKPDTAFAKSKLPKLNRQRPSVEGLREEKGGSFKLSESRSFSAPLPTSDNIDNADASNSNGLEGRLDAILRANTQVFCWQGSSWERICESSNTILSWNGLLQVFVGETSILTGTVQTTSPLRRGTAVDVSVGLETGSGRETFMFRSKTKSEAEMLWQALLTMKMPPPKPGYAVSHASSESSLGSAITAETVLLADQRVRAFLRTASEKWDQQGFVKMSIALMDANGAKKVTLRSEKGKEVLLDRVVGEHCFERLGGTGIAISVMDEGHSFVHLVQVG